jgi:NAD(P)-dependent dehydrogenase (short-subunit alcohol dehydrogenase family)
MKHALITGANKGIGLEIARGLGQQGFHVLLGARDAGRGQAAADTLRAEGLNAEFIEIDVTNAASIENASVRIEHRHGHLDVLVNNAGISVDLSQPPSAVSLAQVRTTYETNVFGAIAVTQAMLPLLKKAQAGRIVNMSSGLGSMAMTADVTHFYNSVNLLAYNSSKAALNAVTVQFANELRQTPIKVNAADPGYTATDLNGHSGPRTPTQAAKVALHLATLDSEGPTAGYFDEDGALAW